MRRVTCPGCGIKVEQIPWAEGKNNLTTTYASFLARWAMRFSWKQVADSFQSSWYNVYRTVRMSFARCLANRNLNGVIAIGIDDIAGKRKA